jgi:hypothetical protein
MGASNVVDHATALSEGPDRVTKYDVFGSRIKLLKEKVSIMLD